VVRQLVAVEKSHKFYASLGSTIEHQQIQVTVQGQTISSNFGTLDSCRYNLENLLTAGATNQVFAETQATLTEAQKSIARRNRLHRLYQVFRFQKPS